MKKVAIIVGRFQVPSLTKGHLKLLKKAVMGDYYKTIIFIGITKEEKLTLHDPLPYEARRKMIMEELIDFKDMIEIFPIHDLGDYPRWVKRLDEKIEALKTLGIIPENSIIKILGSRDSVATRYKENGGTYEVQNISEVRNISGTMIRKEIRQTYEVFNCEWDKKLRKFAIWYSGKLLS